MNKIFYQLIKSAVIFSSVFFATSTFAAPQDWQQIKRPIPAENGKAEPIGSYSTAVLSAQNPCLIKAKAIKLFG